ncbi:MAG: hypothetical protein NTZ84_03850 [Candidatus Nealsonbacteria bacterium]|nr:hypothetical protein [Candidatus Nealsonbacteria bacterium]
MWKKQISDLLKKMGKMFYDIIPPKAGNVRIKSNNFKTSIVKIAALALIITLSWAAISSIHNTLSYFSDTEESKSNDFTAGALDFELSSTQVFPNMIISTSTPATGTISIVNLYNIPKYKVTAVNLSGALCSYLNLKADLDGAEKYSGPLTGFDSGTIEFVSPDDWFFTLTLPANATDTVVGETCNFNFSFYGSQIRNNLPLGQGFSDTENASGSVKAKMCFDSETRSKDYWKDHLDVAKPYLPQMLGNAIVTSTSGVYKILYTDYGPSMVNQLEGQLLTMKLNVAHFGIGDYIPNGTSSNLSQIIAEADNLLKTTSTPDYSVLETMKNLLEGLNNNLSIKVCTETGVRVLITNGGEHWWIGRSYDLTWTTKNLGCPDSSAHINIWYSNDSGNTWANIITGTENNGIYDWERIPLYLENTYYMVSDKARIKVVAVCTENLMVAGWDISDYDFCPPIDPSLLTPEELELAIALGLIQEEVIVQESTTTEEQVADATTSEPIVLDIGSVSVPILTESAPASDSETGGADQTPVIETPTTTQENTTTSEQAATSTEEVSTSTEEVSTTTDQGGIIDTINDIIENVVNEIIEVITPEATTTEPAANATTTEATETTTIEQAPVAEEQPAVVPENNPTEPVPPAPDGSGV